MITLKNLRLLLCLGLLGCLLQGCGAERDTAFNPSTTSSSSSSSLGTSLSGTERLYSGTTPLYTPDDLNKKLVAIRNETQMDYYWGKYVSNDPWDGDVVNFDEGQVLLIDRGQLGQCDSLISIKSVAFYDYSPNSIKAVIKYDDTGNSSSASSASSSSYSEPNCDDGLGTVNQPFRFYYVPSRKVLVIQEDI